MDPRQSSSACFNLQYYMPAQYCASCEFPFKQMGACPAPGQPILYAYISLLPYLIPLLYLLLSLALRSLDRFKVFSMLASSYILGDKLCKPLFKSPRPENSCKTSFGMPSSHMVVMAAFAIYRIRETTNWGERVFWVVITVVEGVSRMQLNYHTLEQVIAGTIFGVIYAMVFQKLWNICLPYLPFGKKDFEKVMDEEEKRRF